MKKLYEVTIRMMVIAENKEDAEFEASRADIDACDIDVIEASSYLTNWADVIPFGSDDDRTCKEIFESRIKQKEKKMDYQKRIKELEEELAVTNKLLTERDRLLKAIPECSAHGDQCISHAIEWVKKAKEISEHIKNWKRNTDRIFNRKVLEDRD